MADPFDDDVVAAITGYMNENQPDVNLLIVQAHGGLPSATAAELRDVSGTSATFHAELEGASRDIVVAWARPIARREHIRRELMELYETALER